MLNRTLRVATALLLLSAAGAGAAAQPPPASLPSAERVREAEQALADIDPDRLGRDQAYAGTVADHLLVLQARPGRDADERYAFQRMLVLALSAAARHDAAEVAADALIQMRPGSAESYRFALGAAAAAQRLARLPLVMERAADGLREPGERAAFVALFEPEHVWSQLHQLRAEKDSQVRLADALLRLGWPGADKPGERADGLRMIVAQRHLERGNRTAAADLVRQVQGVASVLRLVTDRRFDPLVGETDRVARVRAAIDAQDRATSTALAAAPEDTDALVHRATFLRSVGRDREVLDLLLPLMADPALVVARGQRGLWLVNEAAFALMATGSAGEGIELMRPLATMDMGARPDLINTSINFISMLRTNGRNEEALREAERLAVAGAGVANNYGLMIIWANAVCAATDLRRADAAATWLRRMEANVEENRPAMIEALLCRGEMDAAERVLVEAFESDRWRDQAILWLQDWEPRPLSAVSQRHYEAVAQLRARPAVEAAFARAGHRLRLPIPPTYYGL